MSGQDNKQVSPLTAIIWSEYSGQQRAAGKHTSIVQAPEPPQYQRMRVHSIAVWITRHADNMDDDG